MTPTGDIVARDWRSKWRRVVEQSRSGPKDLPFPSPAQVDLLKAALLSADQAAPAWRRWKARGLELVNADDDSQRLFPMLWANREAAAIDADDLPLLKGMYRRTFAANTAHLANGLRASEVLTEAGIPVLFFKGAAILALAGPGSGLRPMGDVDLLVPESQAGAAIAVLEKAGYTSTPGQLPVGMAHARDFRSADGTWLDLHWWAVKLAGDETSMFASAQPATLLGRPVRIPSATECLISTLANAFQFYGAPLRWIADSMFLFETTEIDWDGVLRRAWRPGLTLGLRDGLAFLQREFDAPVPSYVIDELQRRSVSWRERGAHWAAVYKPPVGSRALHQMARHRALRLHAPDGTPADPLAHMAMENRCRRRDMLRRAPRKALREGVVLAVWYAENRRNHTGRRADFTPESLPASGGQPQSVHASNASSR